MKHAALSLAGKYEEKGMHQEAEILGRELLHARVSGKAPKTEVVRAQEYLAGAYEGQGNYTDAIPLRRAAYEAKRQTDGSGGAIRALASDYAAVGRCQEAFELLKSLRSQRNNNAPYLSDLRHLAGICESRGYSEHVGMFTSEIERVQDSSQTGTPTSPNHGNPYQSGRTLQEMTEILQERRQVMVGPRSITVDRHIRPGRSLRDSNVYPVAQQNSPLPTAQRSRPSINVDVNPGPSWNATPTPLTATPLTISPTGDLSDIERRIKALELEGHVGRAAALRREEARRRQTHS
ncbi:hypothetical protein M408DRAFT_227333 [Serendipita vermifera MAFF 305830]|uniref:Uncharacterized protein n=1 Tax=Serendipita vermifera MAFF 305830 TaxID=933852 RepID=A0A0C3AXZ4_SERVB|nr:hypothetical protein M408DRAFT_227333 [Serendipita vermifera MAFF 305830]